MRRRIKTKNLPGLLPAILTTILLTGCDAHIMEKDTSVRPGHVLCVDGSVLAYDELCDQQARKPLL